MHNGNTRGKKNKGTEEILITENICKLILNIKPQINEAQRTPSRINSNKNYILRYTISKLHKIKDKEKERIFIEDRNKKYLTYRGAMIRIISNFPSETMPYGS